MALTKTAEKLEKYNDRLKAGDASKIKPSHVQNVIGKLEARERELLDEIEKTEKPSKKQRLEQKLARARDLMSQAKWLLNEIA